MSHRPSQVASELQKALAPFLSQEALFKRYGLITITEIVVTRGLEQAKIFFTSHHHKRDLEQLLNQKGAKIKKAIHQKVNLRKIPKLVFLVDINTDILNDLIEFQKSQQPVAENDQQQLSDNSEDEGVE